MLFLLLPILLLARDALSCTPLLPRDDNNSTYPFIATGSDEPADLATTGYFINHVGLNTNNLTRSMEFYTRVIGLRHMFTYHVNEYFSVTYMGHSQGGRNGSAYQTTAELLQNKQNSAGLLELLYFNRTTLGGEDIPRSDQKISTLSHLGLIVPDPEATQARLEEYGVPIYKKYGEGLPKEEVEGNPLSLPSLFFGDTSGLSAEVLEEMKDTLGKLNLLNIFAADPDGNTIEILPFHEPSLFG